MITATKAEQPIGQLVAAFPAYAAVFERYGLDYCCGGNRTLAEACQKKKLVLEDVLASLAQADSRPDPCEVNLTDLSLTELCEHIVSIHHEYTRELGPRLLALVDKVARVHGDTNPKLIGVQTAYQALWNELLTHMHKEEHVLFPFCIQQEVNDPFIACGNQMPVHSLEQPISALEQEHFEVGRLLEQIRSLCDEFVPPDWACNTYRVMLHELQNLERDLHLHIHKENNILFPRTLKAAEESGWTVSPGL